MVSREAAITHGAKILCVTLQNSTTMSGDGNVPSANDGPPKQQGGTLLPFLDNDFKSYHNTEWYQWELN
eukprot:9746515-Ditylum_brightwellii.AAC.1